MRVPLRITVIVFRLTIIAGIAVMLVVSGCEGGDDQQESKVIAWAEEFGMAVDEWQAGQIPDENFDEDAWIEKGCAIPEVEHTLQKLLQERDSRIEPILLVRALGFVGTAESVPLLIKQLEDDWSVMRAEAIGALGRIGGPEAIRTLAEQLQSGTATERRSAAWAFVKLGDPVGIEVMEDAIKSLQEEEEFIKQALVELRHELGQRDQEPSSPASEAAVAASLPATRP